MNIVKKYLLPLLLLNGIEVVVIIQLNTTGLEGFDLQLANIIDVGTRIFNAYVTYKVLEEKGYGSPDKTGITGGQLFGVVCSFALGGLISIPILLFLQDNPNPEKSRSIQEIFQSQHIEEVPDTAKENSEESVESQETEESLEKFY